MMMVLLVVVVVMVAMVVLCSGVDSGDDNHGVDGNGTASWALTLYCFKPLTCINLLS